MIWRPLSLDEALRSVARVVGRPPQLLLADASFMAALELALDDPYALHREPAPHRVDAYIFHVAENTATIIERLIRAATVPVPAVHEIVVRTLRRSHVRWDAMLGLELIGEFASGSADGTELASALRSQLALTPGLAGYVEDRSDWTERLGETDGIPSCPFLDDRPFDPDDVTDPAVRGAIPTLYLGHPITELRPVPGEFCIDLESIRYQTLRAVGVVLNSLPAPAKIRLCHPGQQYRPPRMWNADEVRRLVDLGLEVAHGLLYVGVSGLPIGIGGCYELMRFGNRPGGQIAVAQPPDCPHSPMESLLLDDAMRVTTATPEDGPSLAGFIASWFDDSFEELLACQRRMHNRQLLSSSKRDAAVRLIKGTSSSQLRRALAVSGISIRKVERLLDRRDTMTDISCSQMSLFLQHLQDRPTTGRARWRNGADELTA